MAIVSPPVTVPSTLYPQEITASMQLIIPVSGIPQFTVISQIVNCATATPWPNTTIVNVQDVEYNAPYTFNLQQFLILCPEYQSLQGSLIAAMDLLKTRMPTRSFVWPNPTLITRSPSVGPAAGGTVVSLSGTGFGTGMMVSFGEGTPVAATVTTAEAATVVAPAGIQGDCIDLTVIMGPNRYTLAQSFIYE
jgi:hypothetical protein